MVKFANDKFFFSFFKDIFIENMNFSIIIISYLFLFLLNFIDLFRDNCFTQCIANCFGKQHPPTPDFILSHNNNRDPLVFSKLAKVLKGIRKREIKIETS